jgi:hypothetical protein
MCNAVGSVKWNSTDNANAVMNFSMGNGTIYLALLNLLIPFHHVKEKPHPAFNFLLH